MYKKIGIIFSYLLLFQCNSTFSNFIKERKYSGFLFSISYTDMLPIIEVKVKEQYPKNSLPKKIRLVIDTGSNVSILNKKTYPDSFDTSIKKMSLQSLSNSSEIEYSEKYLDFYQGEEIIFERKKMLSTNFPDVFQFDGIMGNDLLSEFDVVLNFPQSIFLMKKKQSINLTDYGFIGAPLVTIKNYIALDVFVDSSDKRKFLLDTGSGFSYIAVNENEIANFRFGEKAFYFDALGKIQASEKRIAKSVCFISRTFCIKNAEFLTGNDSFQVNAFKTGDLKGLIGMNWLIGKELVISYSDQKIYYRQNSD